MNVCLTTGFPYNLNFYVDLDIIPATGDYITVAVDSKRYTLRVNSRKFDLCDAKKQYPEPCSDVYTELREFVIDVGVIEENAKKVW